MKKLQTILSTLEPENKEVLWLHKKEGYYVIEYYGEEGWNTLGNPFAEEVGKTIEERVTTLEVELRKKTKGFTKLSAGGSAVDSKDYYECNFYSGDGSISVLAEFPNKINIQLNSTFINEVLESVEALRKNIVDTTNDLNQKIAKLQEQLDNDYTDIYDVINSLGSVYNVQGSKETLSDLLAIPSAKKGDVYSIEQAFNLNGKLYAEGTNVVCIRTFTSGNKASYWDAIGGTFNQALYLKKAEAAIVNPNDTIEGIERTDLVTFTEKDSYFGENTVVLPFKLISKTVLTNGDIAWYRLAFSYPTGSSNPAHKLLLQTATTNKASQPVESDWETINYINNISLSSLLSRSDVANNLTTTASGKVLDARQGKVLADLIANKSLTIDTYSIFNSYSWENKGTLTAQTLFDLFLSSEVGYYQFRIDDRTYRMIKHQTAQVSGNNRYVALDITGSPTWGYIHTDGLLGHWGFRSSTEPKIEDLISYQQIILRKVSDIVTYDITELENNGEQIESRQPVELNVDSINKVFGSPDSLIYNLENKHVRFTTSNEGNVINTDVTSSMTLGETECYLSLTCKVGLFGEEVVTCSYLFIFDKTKEPHAFTYGQLTQYSDSDQITTGFIANEAVTTEKIANKTITKDKLADGVLPDNVVADVGITGTLNVTDPISIAAAQDLITKPYGVAFYLITDRNGKLLSKNQEAVQISAAVEKFLSFRSPNPTVNNILEQVSIDNFKPRGFNVGDIIALSRVPVGIDALVEYLGLSSAIATALKLLGLSEIEIYQYKIWTTNDAKWSNFQNKDGSVVTSGVKGLMSVWDKEQVDKVPRLEANDLSTKYGYGTNFDDCLTTGVCAYSPATIGGVTENFTLVVQRSSTVDSSGFYTIIQSAYGRTGEVYNRIFQRMIFHNPSNGTIERHDWVEISTSAYVDNAIYSVLNTEV